MDLRRSQQENASESFLPALFTSSLSDLPLTYGEKAGSDHFFYVDLRLDPMPSRENAYATKALIGGVATQSQE